MSCADVDVCVAVGAGGTFLSSPDGGVMWTSQSTGGGNSPIDVSCPSVVGTCVAVSHQGTVFTSQDGGAGWTSQKLGTTDTLLGVSCAGASACVAVGGDTILTSSDGGAMDQPTGGRRKEPAWRELSEHEHMYSGRRQRNDLDQYDRRHHLDQA